MHRTFLRPLFASPYPSPIVAGTRFQRPAITDPRAESMRIAGSLDLTRLLSFFLLPGQPQFGSFLCGSFPSRRTARVRFSYLSSPSLPVLLAFASPVFRKFDDWQRGLTSRTFNIPSQPPRSCRLGCAPSPPPPSCEENT